MTSNHKIKKLEEKIHKFNNAVKEVIKTKTEKIDFSTCGYSGVREGIFDGKPIERVIIILRGTGCAWAREIDGGCTMCGHLSGSSIGKRIPGKMLKQQFDEAYSEYDYVKYPVLCLYNGGSMLNEEEISKDLRKYFWEIINRNPHIKKLIIESRPQYITTEVIEELNNAFTDTIVEIGFGIEAKNDIIRNVILNKNIEKTAYDDLKNRVRSTKIRLLAYILVKPPFLTEAEAIMEAIESVRYAYELGVDAVSLEPVSIQSYTLVSLLSKAGCFSPPWIWSILKIVKDVYHLGIEVRIGGFEFFPLPEKFVSNCETCNYDMTQIIREFNLKYDPAIFYNAICNEHCDQKWLKELEEIPEDNLVDRALKILDSINVEKGISVYQ